MAKGFSTIANAPGGQGMIIKGVKLVKSNKSELSNVTKLGMICSDHRRESVDEYMDTHTYL